MTFFSYTNDIDFGGRQNGAEKTLNRRQYKFNDLWQNIIILYIISLI